MTQNLIPVHDRQTGRTFQLDLAGKRLHEGDRTHTLRKERDSFLLLPDYKICLGYLCFTHAEGHDDIMGFQDLATRRKILNALPKELREAAERTRGC